MKNIGTGERVARAALGGQLATSILANKRGARVLGILGIALLATAISGYCPVYDALDVDTTKVDLPRQLGYRFG